MYLHTYVCVGYVHVCVGYVGSLIIDSRFPSAFLIGCAGGQ